MISDNTIDAKQDSTINQIDMHDENHPYGTDPIDVVDIEEDDIEDEEMDGDDDDDESQEIDDEIDELVAAANTQKSNNIPALDFKTAASKLMKPIPDYPVKDQTHYVWEIKDWASMTDEKYRSPTFQCGGYNWNILLFPRGNNGSNAMSLYMEPHPIDESNPDWYVCAQFALDIWNPLHPEAHLPSGSSHRFNKNETDWGFSSLTDEKRLQVPTIRHGSAEFPVLGNNQVNITGYVKVIDDSSTGVLWHSFIDYDSKKHTKFVGLNNQGATCYLNSLLQSYFTTAIFRKLVYQIPTAPSPNTKTSVPLALQRIFYLLSTAKNTVGTMELTKSFGWDTSDAFTQHDVQELNRILMDKLETAMKGSPIENCLNDIFVGKMKSYIKCVNVKYESSRIEDFWDIQLNVKGFKNLQQSFENYIEIEMLDGENKYQAGEGYGYQDAKKGVVFQSFPPVLHLQLKRFEYDFMVDDLVKIDDLYEFPDKIDLRPYLDEELPEEIKLQNWTYKLHGVLVHQGTVSNGHYYAMIKPGHTEQWLRFDDDKVWKATSSQVFQENYGANEISQQDLMKLTKAEQQENLIRRVTSAYMLVYYRETELDKILPKDESSIDKVIPDHIPNQIKYEIEQAERLESERQEALYYTNIKFITWNNFINFSGFDLTIDPRNAKFYDESLIGTAVDPLSFKVKKNDAYSSLLRLVGTKLGYPLTKPEGTPVDSYPFRLLVTSHRNNQTNRTDVPVSDEQKEFPVQVLCGKVFNKKYDEQVFYVEEANKDIRVINRICPSKSTVEPKDFKFDSVSEKLNKVGVSASEGIEFKDISEFSNYILIFIKYFDPISQQVRGLSHIVVSKDEQVGSIVEPVNELLGFSKVVQLQLFEELSPTKVDIIDQSITFEKSELNNGDIITVQVSNAAQLAGKQKFQEAKDFYRFMLTRLHIQVKPFKAEIDEEDSDFVAEDKTSQNGDNKGKNGESKVAKVIKPIDMWISTLFSYQDLAKAVADHLEDDVDPDYLRLFVLNAQKQRFPLKTHHAMTDLFPKSVNVNQIISFEYEILNINLKEYENLKAVKIHWLTSLIQYQVFELLVPKNSTIAELIAKLIHKVNVPKKDYKHILIWSGSNHTYLDLVKFNDTIETLPDDAELYAGIFPVEVEILVNHDLYTRLEDGPVDIEELDNDATKKEMLLAKQHATSLNMLPAFHFHKTSNYHHGVPFILPIYPEETLDLTKERLRKRLGLGIQAFEKIRFALADNDDKGAYIDSANDKLVLFDEISKSSTSYSFALDHPDRTPRRANQLDKGISIR